MKYQPDIGKSAADSLAQSAASRFGVIDRAAIARTINGIIRGRENRATFFSPDLFADPAWDILLVLALAESHFHRLYISQLCERVTVPTTTVLRWIKVLADNGLLQRRDDVNDRRRKYVELSPAAYAKMAAFCSQPGAISLAA